MFSLGQHIRLSVLALCSLLAAGVIAGCGGTAVGGTTPGAITPGGASTTLNTAYYADPTGGIDPDVFYDVEGDSLMLSVYNTLVTYAPGTTSIVPSLATSWTVSPDGKTYTFQLRRGVVFHDGTAFNAQAVKINFQRRIKLKQAVSYMTADVASMDTPTPYTFVVHLTKRNNAFLDLLASMYGPKIVSPMALRVHAGKDHAMKWLASHEDGTGPYSLVSYQPGNEYVLQAFKAYWGPKPYFSRIVIHVVPDIATAELELRSGSLDMLPHGIAESELQGLKSAGLTVTPLPAAIRQVVALNQSKPPFNSQIVRQTFAAAIQGIDASAVSAVFGPNATPARSAYPQIMSHGSELAPLPTYPKRTLARPAAITMTYSSAEPALLQLGEYFQQALAKVGFKVTLKGDTDTQEFGYISDPSAGPNATISTFNPDAGHPDTWARPVWYTGAGLNFFGFSDKQLDKLIDAAAAAPTPAQSEQLYSQAGARASQDAFLLPVDDAEDVVVSSSSLAGFQHVPVYIWMVNFAALRRR
jgi:peptide/nickel transport system substrate-binding protein